MNSFPLNLKNFDFPSTLDQAFDIEMCFSALQTAAGDELSYVLIDDYNRLVAVIANDLHFPYYIIAAKQEATDFTNVQLQLIQQNGY